MSNKKNLLNEAQVRQFMKLAKLGPLTPGFVHGLTERGEKAGDEGSKAAGKKGDTDYSGKGQRKGDESETHKGKDLEESHGNGARELDGPDDGLGRKRKRGGMMQEQPEDELDIAAAVEEPVPGGEEVEDVEVGLDPELEGPEEGAGADKMISVADLLAALETAIEEVTGEEVETAIDPELEDEAEDEFAPEGDDVVADVEVGEEEEALEEILGFGQSADEKRKKLALGKKGSYAPDPEAGEKSSAPTPEEMAAARADKSGTSPRSKFPRRGGGGGGWKPIVQENSDELVEQITKRVAARILKSALSKK